jgi:hypothetical protein
MNKPMTKNLIKRAILLILLLNLSILIFSQKSDSTKVANYFGGGVTVTNNGISLIPTFSIDKPAVLFDLTAGRGKLSFNRNSDFRLKVSPGHSFSGGGTN